MRILVITLPGLRPDYLGCYGCDWVDTPNLDQLAANGIVFDNHHAVQPDQDGAAAAWLTGSYGFSHPVSESSQVDLLHLLCAAGIETHLIADAARLPCRALLQNWKNQNPTSTLREYQKRLDKALTQLASHKDALLWVDIPVALPPWQIPQNFLDAYFEFEEEEVEQEQEAEDEDKDEDDDYEVDEQIEETLVDSQLTDEPVALEPLLDPPSGLFASLEDSVFEQIQFTFAAAVTYADAIMGQVFESLANVDPDDQWLILVTAPHGQSLGEHGLIDPSKPWLHEERIHVPFLLRLPGNDEAGRRVAALTQALDVPATLMSAFGLPVPNTAGKSLLPLTLGKTDSIRPYSYSAWQMGDEGERSLRTPEWKLIVPFGPTSSSRPRQLYEKPKDRWEVNNVLQHHLDLADEMEETLKSFVKSHPIV